MQSSIRSSQQRIFTILGLFVSASACLLTSCQSPVLQSSSSSAAAKHFTTELGKARVYVYRPVGLAGAIRVSPVYVDGRMLGQNGPGTFLVADLAPGQHTVATSAASINIDALVGRTRFVKQKISVWGPYSSVEPVSEEEGRRGVERCEQAQALY